MKDKQISIRLTNKDYRDFTRVAKKNQQTISEWMRYIARSALSMTVLTPSEARQVLRSIGSRKAKRKKGEGQA